MKRSVREISSTGSDLGRPPGSDELEVSFFGPGYGESILIHVGNEQWILIDSCLNPRSKVSAPLEYLNNIGIDPSETVKLIVATHWHDDHIRGLGDAVRVCDAAQFACSSALRREEFLTLVEVYGKRSMMDTPGIKEFYSIIDVLKNRESTNHKYPSPHWAIADRPLWRETPCEVYALSPSDTSVTLGYHEIAGLLPEGRSTKRGIIAQTPNHVAVVLWVKVGDVSILLGSDLEETANPNTGWSVIVDSTTRPLEKACLFKVPHHGSANADNPRVWDMMLETNPLAVLTPFFKGETFLPTKSDKIRICGRTEKCYSTANITPSKKIKRNGIVERAIRETVRNIRPVQDRWGHVRIRTNILSTNKEWTVELFGDALPLRNMYMD